MKAQAREFLTDSERAEQETSEDTSWGDNFIQIGGIYLCSCWTDTNYERDPRAVIQLRT